MPLQDLHSCRLRRASDFKPDSFRTVDRDHEGKPYQVVRARLKSDDAWEDQAFRYQTEHWTESEARAHCREHKGILFEPASSEDEEALVPSLREAATGSVWAIAPRYMAAITRTLQGGRIDPLLRAGPMAVHAYEHEHHPPDAPVGGIAVVPLVGVLMYRCGLFGELFGASTDGFVRRMRAAAANRDVAAILIDVDSPGGMVDGVPEAWQAVMEIRKKKRVVAIANTLMASAAYWIASAAEEVIATPSAEVGSIGVFALHMELSRMLEEHGIAVSVIRQPPAKAEANPFEPLSDEARAHIQVQVDETYGVFVKQVATGRRVKQDVVREQYGQGRTLLATGAAKAGLIDRVATFDELATELVAELGAKRGRAAMSVASASQDGLTLATDVYETCGGTGYLPESSMGDPTGQIHCPSCNGDGKRLTAGMTPPDVSHDMADADQPWDDPSLDDFTDKDWDELTTTERKRIAGHAAWTAEMPPDAYDHMKLFHHRPEDGKVVLRGVQACGNAMMGARGGVEMPDEDRAAVKEHLRRHYRAFNKPVPEGLRDDEVQALREKALLVVSEELAMRRAVASEAERNAIV